MKQNLKQSSIENPDKNCEELLSNLIVSVELDINSPNDLRSYIKCYCGVQSSVSKRVTAGHLKKTWILGNFYRHLLTHNKFNPEVKKTVKSPKKNV